MHSLPRIFRVRFWALLVLGVAPPVVLVCVALLGERCEDKRAESDAAESSGLGLNKKIQGKGFLIKDHVEASPHALLPDCSLYTDELGKQNVQVNLDHITYPKLKTVFASQLQKGGHHCPVDCRPRERTAIIIPYRDRRDQLMRLLHNLIPFLSRQKICFTVFVVEQTPDFPFNRCLLFNVGFVESQRGGHYSCFILHDADLIPIHYGNLYHCHGNRPRHFVTSRSNKPFSGLPYKTYIGGVLAVQRQQMETINGCSNVYYGWGFEDDDLYKRFQLTNQIPVRYNDASLGEYVAIDHEKQRRNRQKLKLLSSVELRMKEDGLNTLNYTLEDFQERELYTWLLVRIPPPPSSLYPAWKRAPHQTPH